MPSPSTTRGNKDENLGEVPALTSPSSGKKPEEPARPTTTISKNIALSLARVAVNSLVALVLPAYLTHRLPVATYGAWVLILQLGAFVSFLDFGVQTGVAKFVAEYDAKGNETEAGRSASAGLAIMTLTGILGLGLTFILAWQVPRLFHNMPATLFQDVRISVLLIGGSLSFGLVCSVFSAVFVGLQRYAVPMGIAIVNRTLFTAAVLVAVFLHSSLAAMGVAAALVNITTGLLQVVAWRRMASRIRISLALVDSRAFRQMARYCSLLAIWTVGMICVSGLDVTIVGHYAYNETAYYSVATLPTNFMILIISSMLGPMMPATSALSTKRSASEMGDILARTTRYSTTLLLLTGLPLMVCGFPILRLWVGPVYALHSLTYLRILVIANIIRSLCSPYATMIAATGKQGAVIVAPICEAVINLVSSVYLASRFGAMGVAFGTLLGSLVSISLHFTVSMHLTRNTLAIPRTRLFLRGLCRPATITIPSIIFLLFCWPCSRITLQMSAIVLWGLGTLLFAWFGNLNREERNKLMHFAKWRLMGELASTDELELR
jgi:O-antigen/teichoic acid export membrane protein